MVPRSRTGDYDPSVEDGLNAIERGLVHQRIKVAARGHGVIRALDLGDVDRVPHHLPEALRREHESTRRSQTSRRYSGDDFLFRESSRGEFLEHTCDERRAFGIRHQALAGPFRRVQVDHRAGVSATMGALGATVARNPGGRSRPRSPSRAATADKERRPHRFAGSWCTRAQDVEPSAVWCPLGGLRGAVSHAASDLRCPSRERQPRPGVAAPSRRQPFASRVSTPGKEIGKFAFAVTAVDRALCPTYAALMNLQVPPELEAKLTRLAAETGRTVDQVAIDLLASAVDNDEWVLPRGREGSRLCS